MPPSLAFSSSEKESIMSQIEMIRPFVDPPAIDSLMKKMSWDDGLAAEAQRIADMCSEKIIDPEFVRKQAKAIPGMGKIGKEVRYLASIGIENKQLSSNSMFQG